MSRYPLLPSSGLIAPLPRDPQAGLHLALVNRGKGVKGHAPAKLGSEQVKRKAGSGPPSSGGLLIALALPSSPATSASPRPPSLPTWCKPPSQGQAPPLFHCSF